MLDNQIFLLLKSSVFEPVLALLVGLQVVSSKVGGREGEGGNFLSRFCCLDYMLMPALKQSGILWGVTKGVKPWGGRASPTGKAGGGGKPGGATPRVLG